MAGAEVKTFKVDYDGENSTNVRQIGLVN
jgi:hypothetical protein